MIIFHRVQRKCHSRRHASSARTKPWPTPTTNKETHKTNERVPMCKAITDLHGTPLFPIATGASQGKVQKTSINAGSRDCKVKTEHHAVSAPRFELVLWFAPNIRQNLGRTSMERQVRPCIYLVAKCEGNLTRQGVCPETIGYLESSTATK